MKNIVKLLFLFILIVGIDQAKAQGKSSFKQVETEKPYHPEADAQKDIDSLIAKAKKESKHIVLQAGGNWCVWCLRFNNYIHEDQEISQLLKKNYLYYHLNYSKENKNEAVFKKLAPEGEKLGYPFFIILNEKGEVLKIQESGSLEKDKSYDKEKVLGFFQTWTKK